MFDDHYNNWRISRINGIIKYVKRDILYNSTLLELGCGYGDNGNIFSSIFNCKVTCTDARIEHIMHGKEKYKHLDFKLLDSDKELINNKYDIILHWGLLYHLENVEQNLSDCCNNCNYMFLETEVCDSDKKDIILDVDEGPFYDQSFHGKGKRPSQQFVENILLKNNFNFKMITDDIINSTMHIYNWNISNTNTWRHGLRRYWICWKKDVISPLI